MGLRINTNISSLMAQRHLASATRELQDSYRKLSSGLRVQSASDDAAALAISERMRSQVRALEAARRNANDGISLAQTAEGSLDEMVEKQKWLKSLDVPMWSKAAVSLSEAVRVL